MGRAEQRRDWRARTPRGVFRLQRPEGPLRLPAQQALAALKARPITVRFAVPAGQRSAVPHSGQAAAQEPRAARTVAPAGHRAAVPHRAAPAPAPEPEPEPEPRPEPEPEKPSSRAESATFLEQVARLSAREDLGCPSPALERKALKAPAGRNLEPRRQQIEAVKLLRKWHRG